eukprot:6189797-Pleurochrysis_carterae.AAC.3
MNISYDEWAPNQITSRSFVVQHLAQPSAGLSASSGTYPDDARSVCLLRHQLLKAAAECGGVEGLGKGVVHPG